MKRFLTIAGVLFLLTLTLAHSGICAAPLQLLTLEEAALPEAKSFGFAAALRNDGPSITARDLEVAAGDRTFPLEVAFAPKDGSQVDVGTLKMECLKSTTIDLTPRIKPFADKNGVKVDSISLPPGSYRFRVAISDFMGRFSEKEFTVRVTVNY